MKKLTGVQAFFFSIIFLFSTALAYFSASYIEHVSTVGYYVALLLFGAVYIILGIVLINIVPVSLGFLFPADILILHTLIQKYSAIDDIYKTIIIGVLLVAAYFFAWLKLRDVELVNVPIPPQPQPPVTPTPPQTVLGA